MKRQRELKFSNSAWLAAFVIVALGILCAHAAFAQNSANEQAETQYQKAEQTRAAFEAQPESNRSLADYKKLVAAYRRVYLLSSSAGAVTPALMEVAQLYHTMGDEFDQAYYQNALATYKFLISQYPGSKFRPDALFEIGKIEKEDAQNAADAKDAFAQFLKTYPHSPRVAEARAELKEIAEGKLGQTRTANGDVEQSEAGTRASRRDSRGGDSAQSENAKAEDASAESRDTQAANAETVLEKQDSFAELHGGPARVTAIRTWNADDYTRVVVDLDGNVKYQSARIKNPDRIYFDLYKAQLGQSVTEKELPIQNGFLKVVRVAQNKQGVVRLVLDVQSVEGYSAFLLPDPYRLVIDVHGDLRTASNKKAVPEIGPARLAGDAPTATATAPVATGPASEKVQVAVNQSHSETRVNSAAEASTATGEHATKALPVPAIPAAAARPMRGGERSLTRTLGLKISRIVIDPGHGGHDTGTIGPHGLMEKNVCLDVALRLGKLIQKKLPGAQVIYTRTTDVFVPLEERTAIANQAKADLFISIHANSSHNETARGIETYYLNFTSSPEALETASRENALSDASIHQLQDFIRQIARNDKIEESRELASDIQTSLTGQLRMVSTAERNRGVKKAPFVVLIGADMPSVLAEISFLSNPTDERMLRKSAQRERIARGIFRGVESYLSSLNSLALDRGRSQQKQKVLSAQQAGGSGAAREQR